MSREFEALREIVTLQKSEVYIFLVLPERWFNFKSTTSKSKMALCCTGKLKLSANRVTHGVRHHQKSWEEYPSLLGLISADPEI